MTCITDLSEEVQAIMQEIITTIEDFKKKGVEMKELDALINLMIAAKEGVPNMGGITHLELPKQLADISDKQISPKELINASPDKEVMGTLIEKAYCIEKFKDIKTRWFKLYGTGKV